MISALFIIVVERRGGGAYLSLRVILNAPHVTIFVVEVVQVVEGTVPSIVGCKCWTTLDCR